MSKKRHLDVGNENHVKERKTVLELKREREVEELKQILDTYGGRALIWRVLSRCGIYRSPVTHPQETFRQMGHQDIGRWLLEEVFTSDKNAYTVIRQEGEERDSGEG